MPVTSCLARVAVLAALLVPGLAAPAAAAPDASSRQVFVGYGAGVVGVDVSTGRVGSPASVDGQTVSGFSVSPDARTVWMTAFGGSMLPLDITTGTVGDDLGSIGCDTPVLSPDGRYSWQIERCGPDDTRAIVDRQELTTGQLLRIPLGPDLTNPDQPLSVLVSPDGRTAYVNVRHTDGSTGVRLVDAATGALGASFPAPDGAGVLLTPDGTTMVLRGASRVTLVDLPSRRATASVPLTVRSGAAITPDGSTAWFGVDGALVPLDLRRHTLGRPIRLGYDVAGVAIAPGGTRAYVGLRRGSAPVGLAAVDLVARTVSSRLLRRDGYAPVVMPSQAPHAAFAARPACHGRATRFDAGASRAVDGRIARYDWTFGDGTRTTASTPVVTHTYAAAGRRSVTLTVTDLSGTSTQRVYDGAKMLRNGGPAARAARTITIC